MRSAESRFRLRVRNPQDFWSGVLFLAVGVLAVVLARGYPMGNALRMGPAFFPTILGALLALVGAATLLRGLIEPGGAIGRFAWRDLLLILSATVLFGALIRTAGLAVATVVIVFVGASASTRFRVGPTVLLAIGLAAFVVLLFITALGMPIPLIGPWLGG